MRYSVFLVALCSIKAQESPAVVTARHEMERVEQQITSGALPAAKLADARENLEDALDEAVLEHTLYARIEDFTEPQITQMMDAAQHRVDRQQKKVSKINDLVMADLLPHSESKEPEAELASRTGTLQHARELATLARELAAMAETETRPAEEKTAGTRLIEPLELKDLTLAFEKHFSEPFPVSARGMTAFHRALGFDHTGRVDVAVNPDSPEGIWLREYLNIRAIPYYAFRTAIAGKATAPHIHIGPSSTRL
ncbi:MAG: hypothetical protein ABSF22_05705 [Bryobacteraceae bacterium]|jgi:hypothetical protein